MLIAVVAVALTRTGFARQESSGSGPAPGRISLSGQVEIARLVDLAAQRMNMSVAYDAALLKGTVTLRLAGDISDGELWALTNQVLATQGLTSVVDRAGTLMRIVKAVDAGSAAGLQPSASPDADREGFGLAVVRVEHQSVKIAIESIKPILSKPSGTVSELGASGLILIADLRPKIDDALAVLKLVDIPAAVPVIEIVTAEFTPPVQLASLISTAAAARDSLTQPLRGKVLALPDGSGLMLICPDDELTTWRDLAARFDKREPLITASYAPRHFGIPEVARLVEQTCRDRGPRGSGEQWRLVTDELTGSLIITGTSAEQQCVKALIDRLDSVPDENRRPVRVFVIRNRNVKDIVEVVNKLIESGVLDSAGVQDADIANRPPGSGDFAPRSQTTINLQPPAGSSSANGGEGRTESNGNMVGPRATGRSNADDRRQAGARPSLKLTADDGTNTLIAIGEPPLLTQLENLIRQLDVRQPQVMIEVLVISLSDSDALNLGVEIQRIEINGSTIVALSSLFGLGSPALAGGGSGNGGGTNSALPRGRGFTGVVLDPGDFSVVVRALQTLNKGRSLSMPKVLVNNNQQATLNSVLQQPFSSTNASTTVATTSFGGTQDAGTTVTVKPQIAEGDHLILDYSVTLSAFVGEAADPSLPPPRQSNNLTSAVTIPDGYTIVVGGLELTTIADGVSQVPLLGSIPILGEAFKNRAKSQSRTKFYVFIHSEVLRNSNFDDLKFLSDQTAKAVDVDDGWPKVEPRIIR